MRRPILLAAVLLLAAAAHPCGPDFPTAIFVLTTGPDGSYAAYAAGHLGVPQKDYRTRHLVLAYDTLTHRPLTPAEQRQAIAVNDQFLDPEAYNDAQSKSAPPTGFTTWIAARNALGPLGSGPLDGYTPTADLQTGRGLWYAFVPICLDDAFANAAKTLAARSAAYGAKSPAVLDWVRAQDAVFTNCGDGKPTRDFAPGPPPPPPPAPRLPAAAPANAPLWLQQDRAYQLAAASFYAANNASDYDATIAQFRAIAADTASPWSVLSRYLIARTLIRKATLADQPTDGNISGTPLTDEQRRIRQAAYQQQLQQAADQRAATLQQAQHELLAMRSEPRMAPMLPAIANLLDYVSLRVDPNAQAAVLAGRLHAPPSASTAPRFAQALIDLTWIRTNHLDSSAPTPPNTPKPGSNDMLAWIDAISSGNETLSLQHWHATPTTVWLVAALSFAQPADAATPELLRAAESIPPTDPAFTAVAYHRLRLLPRDATTRAQLLAVLPRLDKAENISTFNLFAALNASTAPTLADWLRSAGRTPAEESFGYVYNSGGDVMPQNEDICGSKIPAHSTELFDTDAAVALNRQLPLRLLAEAAESPILPTDLRYQVAQAAWARAVLLDLTLSSFRAAGGSASPGLATSSTAYGAIAHRMSPILIHCRAAWQPVLAAYDAAKAPDDHRATALFALLRFASTEPSVREGEERRSGFATYDEYRQNWWCTTVPAPGLDVDYAPTTGYFYGRTTLPTPPPPLFLTPADLAESATEVAALEKVPSASTFLAQQALAWQKLHPDDPRTPELLGQADRVLRNSCRTERPRNPQTGQPAGDPNDPTLTANLAHALFDALHTHYPNSPWTKRYKTWE